MCGNASWDPASVDPILSLPTGELPNVGSAESRALHSLCKPGGGTSLLYQTMADALSCLLLFIKKKKNNPNFLHKAELSFRKPSKMESQIFSKKVVLMLIFKSRR